MSGSRLRNRSRDAVFLCYHSISEGGPPFLSIAPDAFERQLATLRRLGFRSGTLDDLEQIAAGRRPKGRTAFLTFDDGYRDNYVTARPLLETYGFRALVFVLPPLLDGGEALAWPRVAGQLHDHPEIMRSMTWAMVEEMAGAGHRFGSHTLSHPRLPDVGDEALRAELSDSRTAIERRLGSCTTVAYPFGVWSPRVAAAAAAAGYSHGFTLPYGAQATADRLTIPRISVDHRDDERRFRLKLTGAYRAFLLSQLKPAARRVLGRSPAHEAAG